MGVGGPGGLVGFGLVAPDVPAGALASGEEFEVGAGGTVFDELLLLVGLAGVLTFAGAEDADLAAAGFEGPHGAADPEEQDFGRVAEVEADAGGLAVG